MRRRWCLSALLSAGALWTGASSAQPVKYEPVSYNYEGIRVDAELGRFTVPQKHSRPNGPKLKLAFMRLKSTASRPGPPIVYLAGGPGGSGIDIAKGPRGKLFLELRKVADVIALDQRGIGKSQPSMKCEGELELSTPATRANLLKQVEEASRRCAARLRAHGVELGAFNIVESAHDVDALRRVLGVGKISLWGSSYGSQLGFAVLRYHDRNIHRVVFSGVEGPDHTLKLPDIVERQLQRLDSFIKADVALRARYAEPQAVVARRVLTRAQMEPLAVTGTDGQMVRLGPFDIQMALAGLIGTRGGMAVLPATLAALDRRDASSELVQDVAAGSASLRTFVTSAIPFAVDCQLGATPSRMEQVRQLADNALVPDPDFPIPEACGAWGLKPLPAAARTPVRSGVPILFFSGTLDGRTPPSNVIDLLPGFSNARQVLIEGSGHGHDLFVGSPDIARDTLAFFGSGEVPVSHITLPALPIQ